MLLLHCYSLVGHYTLLATCLDHIDNLKTHLRPLLFQIQILKQSKQKCDTYAYLIGLC
ncbi:hypothetical protein PAHAL_5G455200 [Panicum hallii]|uniref:Uncharacterized protein n=1 Tax=Panicum hallii TaxID=206008 RepID=A0A2T8INF1_9POAL|nr:hypothetical protein PAHAL_5G455200 [Panicum hallii]